MWHLPSKIIDFKFQDTEYEAHSTGFFFYVHILNAKRNVHNFTFDFLLSVTFQILTLYNRECIDISDRQWADVAEYSGPLALPTSARWRGCNSARHGPDVGVSPTGRQ